MDDSFTGRWNEITKTQQLTIYIYSTIKASKHSNKASKYGNKASKYGNKNKPPKINGNPSFELSITTYTYTH